MKTRVLVAMSFVSAISSFAFAGNCFDVPFSNDSLSKEVVRFVATHFECPVAIGPGGVSQICEEIQCRKALSAEWSSGPSYTYACELNRPFYGHKVPLTLSFDAARDLTEGLFNHACEESNSSSNIHEVKCSRL